MLKALVMVRAVGEPWDLRGAPGEGEKGEHGML